MQFAVPFLWSLSFVEAGYTIARAYLLGILAELTRPPTHAVSKSSKLYDTHIKQFDLGGMKVGKRALNWY